MRIHSALAAGLVLALSACSALVGLSELTPGTSADGPDASPILDGGGRDGDSADGAPKDASAKCDGGLCKPVPLTSSEVDLADMIVAGDRVLYRADNRLRTVGLNGGLATVLLQCANPSGLVATDAGFYSWCSTYLTLRDIADGGVVTSSVVNGHELAVGGGWLFFIYGSTALEQTPDTLADAGFTEVGSLPLGLDSMKTNSSDLFVMTHGGILSHAPLGTAGLTELEHDQTDPSEIAVDDQGVFWATDRNSDQAVLHARPLGAGASAPIATQLDHPDGTALDGSYVYVALRGTPPAYANGKIVRVPRGGGAVEPLAEGIVYPQRIAVTQDYVVFSSRGADSDAGFVGGAIYRLPK